MLGTMETLSIEDRKARARTWFEALRNDICAAFERLEEELHRRQPRLEKKNDREGAK